MVQSSGASAIAEMAQELLNDKIPKTRIWQRRSVFMNDSLAVFSFNNQEIRIFGTLESPCFVAQDICKVLELGNVSKALERIDSEDLGDITLSDTIGRKQNYRTINESGFYTLVLGSRKEVAKSFKNWVTKEVLPSIRRTGKYEIEQQKKIPQTYLEALKELVRAEEENQQLKLQAEQNRPHLELGQAIAFSEDSVSVGDFAKMIGTGRTRLFRKMRDMKIIMKNSTLPYQRFIDAGYFEVSQEINSSNGKIIPFALLTGKGQLWLHGKFKRWEETQKQAIAGILQGVLAFD